VSLLVVGGLPTCAAASSGAVDENISIGFAVSGNGGQVGWQTLGDVPGIFGSLGPFNRACGIVQGVPQITKNVVTRSVYVLDAGNGGTGRPVLYVYDRTDVITHNDGQRMDAVTIVPSASVELPLLSGPTATCHIAANSTSIYIGTNADIQAAVVSKETLEAHKISEPFESDVNDPVSAITAADEGAVVISWGGEGTQDPNCAGVCQSVVYTGNGKWWSASTYPMVVAGSTNGTTF
jgi:hypothetical protein